MFKTFRSINEVPNAGFVHTDQIMPTDQVLDKTESRFKPAKQYSLVYKNYMYTSKIKIIQLTQKQSVNLVISQKK